MANTEQNSYRAKVDIQRIQHIREICKRLPTACLDFLRHIAVTTSTFTRLAYAIDLNTFFQYLVRERASFANIELTAMNDSDFELLAASDLISYTEYLTYYFKSEQLDNDGLPRSIVNHDLAIKRKLCTIRSFYDYLFKSQRISSNVTLLVPLPKIHEKPIIHLSKDEVERMLHQAETGEGMTNGQKRFHEATARRDFAMLMLFLGTGIRVSECVGLNISDINFEENAFLVTRKGGNQVVLYFPAEVATALKSYLDKRCTIQALPGHEDACFLSIQRKRMTQRAVQNMVKKYARMAAPLKPKVSPHKLRSTFATNLYHETGDIYLVADVLGHSSVDTTRKHYADMTDSRRRMAIEYVHLPSSEQEENPATVETEASIVESSPRHRRRRRREE